MKAIVVAAAATLLLATPAAAQTAEQSALAVVAPFYDGLNAAPGKDVAGVLQQATAPDWVSCGANDVCGAREQVIAAIVGRHKAIPDLKWEIKEVLVSGNRVTVRGEATGTPAGEFMGVPHGGKSFKLMSIDVHTIEGGKIVRSYHVEDWLGAVRQLAGNKGGCSCNDGKQHRQIKAPGSHELGVSSEVAVAYKRVFPIPTVRR